jgi:F420-0:gamma-glutamyl ligase
MRSRAWCSGVVAGVRGLEGLSDVTDAKDDADSTLSVDRMELMDDTARIEAPTLGSWTRACLVSVVRRVNILPHESMAHT